MTQSFILMALGIGIGYSITLWLQRSRRTSVPAFGATTVMQSIAHETVSSSAGQISTAVASGGIEELAKNAGAEIVMFVDRCGQLVVVDTDTGIPLREFDDSEHDLHSAKIRFSDIGEPVLYDMTIDEPEPIVEHKKTYEKFRVPVGNPKSGRLEQASVIYFWRFTGSTSCCTWSGGKHRVRNG